MIGGDATHLRVDSRAANGHSQAVEDAGEGQLQQRDDAARFLLECSFVLQLIGAGSEPANGNT